MTNDPDFDLRGFLPYLLALAAEEASLGFQKLYKDRYGMLRTEWRLLFHLGRYGDLTAKEVCTRARIHKTKVSRAVTKLETRHFLTRRTDENDRRHEILSLTKQGRRAYQDLQGAAQTYHAGLLKDFTKEEQERLSEFLQRLAKLDR